MAQVPDPGKPKLDIDPEESLTAAVSPEDAPAVEEFMAEAAQANEAEVEAAAEEADFAATAGLEGAEFANAGVGPYIAFESVCKSFGDFVVLKDVSFFVNPGETLCILGRSGVGKSVSLQILMGFLKADRGGGAGHHVLHRAPDAGRAAEGHDGVPEWSTVRFHHSGRERGFSITGARAHGGGPDSEACDGASGHGGCDGDEGSAAQRSFHRDEALRGDCPGIGGPAVGDSLRRTYDDGRPVDGPFTWESNPTLENAVASHEHCRNS
jgi:energy-coupling factor transporter ATP-binding protein EcfA2